jgi:putative isomerase
VIELPYNKFWNTWSAKSPATMSFIPAEFFIKIGAYSYSAQKYTPFPFSKSIRLYEHHPNGDYCRLTAEHAGTVLGIEYIKPDPWTVMGKIKVLKSGEWGYRFWILLSFGFEREDEGKVQLCNGEARAAFRSYDFAVKTLHEPARSAIVNDVDSVGKDMEASGYFLPEKNEQNGKWALYKYNLEETPEICFTVCAANSYEEASLRAEAALKLYPDFDKLKDGALKNLPGQSGDLPGSIEAIRDVMAWNSIEDEKNRRVFTSLTRYWIDKKFGGWFVWQDDVLYHALLNAWSGDWAMAKENLDTVLNSITPDGNLACLMSEYTEWVDRSQPPIEAFIIWKYCELTGDRQMLETAYPLLKSTYSWWFKNRDGNGNGVLEYGSSCNGHGHFLGTKLAAKDEAAMDNSPMYDSAVFVPEKHTINMEDVALNSLLALDGEILSDIAKKLGKLDESDKIDRANNDFKQRIDRTLWDAGRGIYANRHWDNGFAACSPTSFYPLAAGIPDAEKAEKLIRHIFDENEFWTQAPLPSISKKEESVNDNVYWRGRMWPPLNFFTYVGLKRYRKDKEAYRLARRSMEIFTARWQEERACYENYNTFSGLGGDSVDADPFYGWGALIPLMWVFEHIDIDPWNGFHFGDVMGKTYKISSIKMKDGIYSLECLDGSTKLSKNKTLIFKSNASGRFRHFTYGCHYASVEIDPQEKPSALSFPSCKPARVVIDGHEAALNNTFNLAPKTSKIELWY